MVYRVSDKLYQILWDGFIKESIVKEIYMCLRANNNDLKKLSNNSFWTILKV